MVQFSDFGVYIIYCIQRVEYIQELRLFLFSGDFLGWQVLDLNLFLNLVLQFQIFFSLSFSDMSEKILDYGFFCNVLV